MPPSVQARPFTGIALKVVSTLVFTAMATLIKLVSDRYPVGEMTFFRSFFALIPVCAWVGWRRIPGNFPHQPFRRARRAFDCRGDRDVLRVYRAVLPAHRGRHGDRLRLSPDDRHFRGASPRRTRSHLSLVGGYHRPLRRARHPLGLCRSRPYAGRTEAFLGAVFAIAGAITGALAATQTRSLTRLEPAATIVVYFSTLTAAFSLLTLPFGWVVPGPLDMLYLVVAGIFGGIGQVLLTQSYRFGDASLIAPFDYTSMLWALIVSLAIFGTWPSLTVLAGAGIVIAAGLFVIYREHRLGLARTRSKRAQTPTTPLS